MKLTCDLATMEQPREWFEMDSTKNYSFLFPFEVNWSRKAANDWVRSNWTLSIWASIVYLVAIFGGQRLMRNRKAFELRPLLCVWNAGLCLFSILGFLRTSPEFVRTLSVHGFEHSVCQTTYLQDIVFDFWLVGFVASKFVELFDTAFIVLRRRPLTFLHWYHHITVLIYCWHGGRELTAAGRWFCWMNYGVHSIMYGYYALSACGYRLPRPVSILITSLQITQMVVGCVIVYTVYRVKSAAEQAGRDSYQACRQSWQNLYFCCAIYFSYFCLFVHFFLQAYVFKRKVKTSSSSSSSAAAEIVNGKLSGTASVSTSTRHRRQSSTIDTKTDQWSANIDQRPAGQQEPSDGVLYGIRKRHDTANRVERIVADDSSNHKNSRDRRT